MLLFLSAQFTILAQVLITDYLTEKPLLFPARLCAAGILRTVHTVGTPIQLPTGIKLEVMEYTW